MGRRQKFQGKHVLITGASAGIGLALAEAFLAQGASLTLIARQAQNLEAAAASLAKGQPTVKGQVRVQVADATIPEQINKAIQEAEEAQGPVDVLVCNVGKAHPGYFHEQDLSQFQTAMNVNYFSTVSTIKALYTKMISRGSGHICIIGSVMATMGFIGYASYAPSKYAVRGLADTLRNELQGTGVRISVAFPPDTDTPGLQEENLTKPPECKAISAISEVFKADKVAQGIVRGIAAGRYYLYGPDVGLNLHVFLCQGMACRSFLASVLGLIGGGIIVVAQTIFGFIMDRIARKGARTRFAHLYNN